MALEKRRRIGAYGLCTDVEGRTLLVRASAAADLPGVWSLPGGGLAFGEDPATAVVREFAEETGLTVRVTGVRDVMADVIDVPRRGVSVHHDRIVYDVAVRGGRLSAERGGTADLPAWLAPERQADLPLLPFAAALLGVGEPAGGPGPAGAAPDGADRPARGADHPARGAGRPARGAGRPADGEADQHGLMPGGAPWRRRRLRRFGAYAVATDPAGRLLLTRIAAGFPGAGHWHLPGGGTDHGEQPVAGLLRELAEESGQTGRVLGLLDVSSQHAPAARGLRGRRLGGYHGVRVCYRVLVERPTRPEVTEGAAGSTDAARWYRPAEAARLPLTDLARAALALLPPGPADGTPVARP